MLQYRGLTSDVQGATGDHPAGMLTLAVLEHLGGTGVGQVEVLTASDSANWKRLSFVLQQENLYPTGKGML